MIPEARVAIQRVAELFEANRERSLFEGRYWPLGDVLRELKAIDPEHQVYLSAVYRLGVSRHGDWHHWLTVARERLAGGEPLARLLSKQRVPENIWRGLHRFDALGSVV